MSGAIRTSAWRWCGWFRSNLSSWLFRKARRLARLFVCGLAWWALRPRPHPPPAHAVAACATPHGVRLAPATLRCSAWGRSVATHCSLGPAGQPPRSNRAPEVRARCAPEGALRPQTEHRSRHRNRRGRVGEGAKGACRAARADPLRPEAATASDSCRLGADGQVGAAR